MVEQSVFAFGAGVVETALSRSQEIGALLLCYLEPITFLGRDFQREH